jgi:hypothetical protein
MVVAAGGHERRPGQARGELEAQDADVEVEDPVEVCDLEMDVADVDAGVDRAGMGKGVCHR